MVEEIREIMNLKVMNIVGARPNFMKIAPLMKEMATHPEIETTLVHTGQHYDDSMSKFFFDELEIPKPDYDLGVGSAQHGHQTGKIMIAFEAILLQHKPDVVVVVGDVNSTIACGLTAVKQGAALAHVEAGLRSFDRTMPEEINRLLTDQISDFLFTTEKNAHENLRREGISEQKIFFVGNVMIDTLLACLDKLQDPAILNRLELRPQEYALVTLHRPHNVDDHEQFTGILDALAEIQEKLKVVFPAHPRTRERLARFGLEDRLRKLPGLALTNPLSYIDFLGLMTQARLVLTDSGGIQEETTVLGIPCLTLRENTERPVTVTQGSNRIIGSASERIISETLAILRGDSRIARRPELWDGHAAHRIVNILLEKVR